MLNLLAGGWLNPRSMSKLRNHTSGGDIVRSPIGGGLSSKAAKLGHIAQQRVLRVSLFSSTVLFSSVPVTRQMKVLLGHRSRFPTHRARVNFPRSGVPQRPYTKRTAIPTLTCLATVSAPVQSGQNWSQPTRSCRRPMARQVAGVHAPTAVAPTTGGQSMRTLHDVKREITLPCEQLRSTVCPVSAVRCEVLIIHLDKVELSSTRTGLC